MNEQDKVKLRFFNMVENLLEKHKEVWIAFRFHWDKEEYREAYLIVHEALQELKIKPGKGYHHLDEEFYWLFVN